MISITIVFSASALLKKSEKVKMPKDYEKQKNENFDTSP